MSDSITRRQLEELMMSLSFNIHTDEDIQFLNKIYNNNQADMYIFRLTNTKKYFESIIIPYCKEHWKEIIKTITNENIKNEFILNFSPKKLEPFDGIYDKKKNSINIESPSYYYSNHSNDIVNEAQNQNDIRRPLLPPDSHNRLDSQDPQDPQDPPQAKCIDNKTIIIILIVISILFIIVGKIWS